MSSLTCTKDHNFSRGVSVVNLLLYRTVASNPRKPLLLDFFDGKLSRLLFALFVFSAGTCNPTLNGNYKVESVVKKSHHALTLICALHRSGG